MEFKLKSATATGGLSSRWDFEAILENARVLQALGDSGKSLALLDGKHVAILSGTDRSADADLFSGAARGLGAQVAEIRTELWPNFPREEVQRLAAMLGRLYAAVECQGMLRPIVQQIEVAACIPVYDHLASPDHPTGRVVQWLEGEAPRQDKRKLVLQAVLMGTIA